MKTPETKTIGGQKTYTPANGAPTPAEDDTGTWAERCALIARQPFFKGLKPRQIKQLTDEALEVEFAPGEEIIREGSVANRFFLILEGEVQLETESEDRGMIPIQTLGPGDDLGWSWLISPHVFQFSARAIEPTRAVFFYGPRLRERCEQDHELGYELMKRIVEVVIQRLQATRRQFLKKSE